MKCFQCGQEIPDIATYCTKCGAEQVFTEKVVSEARQGDTVAETKLYNATYDTVYVLVKSMVRDEDTVLDILQDSYVKAFRSLDQLQEASKFRPWLKTIARNRTMDYFRERKTLLFSEMTPLDADDTEIEFEDTNPASMPDVVIDRKETARLLAEILDTLPEDQRGVLSVFYYEQMSIKEIASALGINEMTVKNRLKYGRNKVKASVLDLEKKGTKLYGLSAIPFLVMLLRKSEVQAMEPEEAATSLQKILQQSSNTFYRPEHPIQKPDKTIPRPGSQPAYEAGKEGVKTLAGGGGTTTGTASATNIVGAATGEAAVKAGLPLAIKVLVAVATVAVVGTGVAIAVPTVYDRFISSPDTVSTEPPVDEVATNLSDAADGSDTGDENEMNEMSAEEREEQGRRNAEAVWGDTPVTEYVASGVHFYVPSEYPLRIYTDHDDTDMNTTITVYGWSSPDFNEVQGEFWMLGVTVRTRTLPDGGTSSDEAGTYRGDTFMLGNFDGIAYSITSNYGVINGANYVLIQNVTDADNPAEPPDYLLDFPYDKVMESAWVGSATDEPDVVSLFDLYNKTMGEAIDLLGDDYGVYNNYGGVELYFPNPGITVSPYGTDQQYLDGGEINRSDLIGEIVFSRIDVEILPGIRSTMSWTEMSERARALGAQVSEPEYIEHGMYYSDYYETYFEYQGVHFECIWEYGLEEPCSEIWIRLHR